jgi:hypothetical protein
MYRDGRFEKRRAAWQDLMQWGELEPGSSRWDEAYTVARETMGRARQNVETIIAFLSEEGYVFGPAPDEGLTAGPPWRPPDTESAEQLSRLTALAGPLPLYLRAWYETVGAVCLQGRFPDLWPDHAGLPMTDPLVVEPLDVVLEMLQVYDEEVRYLREHGREDELQHPRYALPGPPIIIAPDVYHKAHVSGGAPYEMRAPDGRADASLLNVHIFIPSPPNAAVPHRKIAANETLVEYLRRSFEWSGFPGHAFQALPGIERMTPLLTELLPI